MQNKDEWNLREIYQNEIDFEKDINLLEELTQKILTYKGRLKESSKIICECYDFLSKALEIEEILTTLFCEIIM